MNNISPTGSSAPQADKKEPPQQNKNEKTQHPAATQIFLKIVTTALMYPSLQVKTVGHFYIPGSLLPEDIKQNLIKTATEEACKIGRLPLKDRVSQWTSEAQARNVPICDEVASVSPFQTKTLKMNDSTFAATHPCAPQFSHFVASVVTQYRQRHFLPENVRNLNKSTTSSSVNVKPSFSCEKEIIYSREETNQNLLTHPSQSRLVRDEFNNLQQKLNKLRGDIANCANTAQTIAPHESLNLIGETLALALLKKLLGITEERKNALISEALEDWNEVRFLLADVKCNPLSKEPLERVINHLNSLQKKYDDLLKKPEISKRNHRQRWNKTWSFLKTLSQDYASWLQVGKDLITENIQKKFSTDLTTFLETNTLKDISACKVTLNSRRDLLQEWFSRRFEHLQHNLDKLRSKNEREDSVLDIAAKIKNAFQELNWLETLWHSKELKESLEKRASEAKDNSQKQRSLQACLPIANALYRDFSTLLEKENLYQTLSTKAYNQLKSSSIHLSKEALNRITAPSLCTRYEILFEVFDEVNQTMQELSDLRRELNTSKNLLLAIRELNSCIENKNYEGFLDLYIHAFKEVSPFFQKWEACLRKLNHHVCKAQDFSFTAIAGSDLENEDLKVLQQEFQQANQNILELITPPTLFFNAFQQLIRINNNFWSGKTKEALSLPFAKEGELRVNLFQTDLACFEAFTKKVQLAHQESSTEEEMQIQWIEEESEGTITEGSSTHSQLNVEEASLPIQQEGSSSQQIAIAIDLPKMPSFQENKKMQSIKKSSTQSAIDTLPTSQVPQSPEEDTIPKEIDRAFNATKTRKIVSSLLQVFKEHGVKYSFKKGKGSHMLLVINGISIPLPVHEEWKPGTAHSIKTAVENQVNNKK